MEGRDDVRVGSCEDVFGVCAAAGRRVGRQLVSEFGDEVSWVVLVGWGEEDFVDLMVGIAWLSLWL